MQSLAPVIWAKGTLLNPQHLQVQDRFLESIVQFRTSALHFCPWGFQTLRLDQEALASGAIAIAEAAGIMPEGLLFDIPDSDQPPSLRALPDNGENSIDAIDVYLGVPEYREGTANVAQPGNPSHVRYSAEAEMIRDEFNDRSEKPVMVARKNFRLLFGDESRQGYSTLRIARIERTPAGLYRIQPQFVPPVIDFRASGYLQTIARRLLEILSGRSTTLSGTRRQRNQSVVDLTASDIPRFWLLYTVNSFLPVFRHLTETRGGHPEPLFGTMLELAGALTAFSDRVQPRDLPRYDHNDLETCFTILDSKLRLLLDSALPDNYVSLPFRMQERSFYFTSIDRDDYFINTRMYLAIKAEQSRAELQSKVPALVKAASGDSIHHIVQQALRGIPLRHVPEPPSAIPVQLDYVYYSLDTTVPEYEAVKRARNLAAYVPADLENPQIELVIVFNAPTGRS